MSEAHALTLLSFRVSKTENYLSTIAVCIFSCLKLKNQCILK